jgi:transcriptional regulator with XRE-family HTH domain
MTFGEKIRAGRKAKGLTQQRLAELAATTVMTISNWERDIVSEPNSSILKAIARELDLSLDELLDAVPVPIYEEAATSDRLPTRLGMFLDMVAVTEPERRHLLSLAGSDGTIDYVEALRQFRTPDHKKTVEAPATKPARDPNKQAMPEVKRRG